MSDEVAPLSPEYRGLVLALAGQFRLLPRSPHGPAHWMRVRRIGLELARHTGANPKVVELFALFHDSCRENDLHDPMHGPRGAVLAELSREMGLFDCTDDELETLQAACYGHTHEASHPDPTIATCWDADRLDLPRVGIDPAPHRLCTEAARSPMHMRQARERAQDWVRRTYPLD
jgi:uncharacterized protein